MKCINKKRKKALFFKLAAVILFLLVVLGIILFFNSKNFKEEYPYNKSIQAFRTSAREDTLVAPGLSSNLCVGEDITPLEGLSLIHILTKTGTLTPAVDFEHLSEVLVIKEVKQQKGCLLYTSRCV